MERAPSQTVPTCLGISSLLLWSSTIAVTRSLSEKVGTITSAAGIALLGGVLGMALILAVPGRWQRLRTVTPRYLAVCGGLFVLYFVCLYLAIGQSLPGQQVIEVTLINYLWPSLTVVFSIPILRVRGGWGVYAGVTLALAGIVLARIPPGGFSWEAFSHNFHQNPWPYVLALGAAVTWALYSNLGRLWAKEGEGGLVPVFFLASGVALLLLRRFSGEASHWSTKAVLELCFNAIFPGLMAYTFWDIAMRRGKMAIVSVLAFFTPVMSVLISSLYLGIALGWNLWLGCALVTGAAALCKFSLRDPTHAHPEKNEADQPLAGQSASNS